MNSMVLRTHSAETISIEAGHGLGAAALQLASQHILLHHQYGKMNERSEHSADFARIQPCASNTVQALGTV